MSDYLYIVKFRWVCCLALFLSVMMDGEAQVLLSNAREGKSVFPLMRATGGYVCYDEGDDEVVKRSVKLFVEDVRLVTGRKLRVLTSVDKMPDCVVIVGTIGKNRLIDGLIARGRLDVKSVKDGWEQYRIEVVSNPVTGVKRALVVAGSDRRGTAYGLLSISEVIGVSPWYWWADVPVKKRADVFLDVRGWSSKRPSVKYRGVFINDEDWGLKPWASKRFEPEVGDIGPRTYAKICELLLRLKANYLCPAMHSCTKAFNYYADNKLVADSFGIVMGSIHCEPLLFNNASEWDRQTMGDWNYVTNRDGINRVLRNRVRSNGSFENVYTLAMRGIHDAVMAGGLGLDGQARVLEQAFDDQRRILANELGQVVEEVPQVFYPYKEVQEVYDYGFSLPDDVTIVWTEDDFGYMKRLSNGKERGRSGRSGVYYHVSYWGPPKHYLWIASTPPALMYEELSKAYRATADRLWVVNVGDIKPAEYPITLFMDMAYDLDRFNYGNINDHCVDFLCNIFGEQYRSDFTDIETTYFREAFKRKPEFMERSTDTEFSVGNYNEADRRLAEYKRIADKAELILQGMDAEARVAFYQLVYYNVKGAELVNQMTLNAQKNREYVSQQRASADVLKERVKVYGDSLEVITTEYNALLDGKWRGMMSLVHGGARSFERAKVEEVKLNVNPTLGIVCEEGPKIGIGSVHALPCFNKYLNRSYYVTVFNKGNGSVRWDSKASDGWIVMDRVSGETQFEDRVMVSVDWDSVPIGEDVGGSIEFLTDRGESKTVYLSVFNPERPSVEEVKGLYVENNGYVSIDAAGFHRKSEKRAVKFSIIEGLGFEGKVVQLGDPFADTPYYPSLLLTSNYVAPVRGSDFPVIEYDFYSFRTGPVDVYTYMMPVFPLDDEHGSRYGVMVDNSPVYLPEAGAPYYSTLWIQSVLRNCRINKTTHFVDKPGKHTVKIYCGHPGMVLQKIVVDFGGVKRSYAGPEITKVQ
jgi:hypothetical protein